MDSPGREADEDVYAAAPGRHVRASGIRLWLEEAGPADGPAVLLVHGLAARGAIWRRVVPALTARGLRVLMPDLPGHGRSDGKRRRATYGPRYLARTLVDLLDAIGVERVTAVGNSLGGTVAARLALQAPERVDRLVLIDSAGLSPDGVPWRTRLMYVPFTLSALVGVTPSPLWMRLFLQAAVVADPADAGELAEAMRRFPPLPSAVRRSAMGLLGPEGRVGGELMHLATPSLLIWGDADVQFPIATAAEIAGRMPHARLARLAGVGHVPQWEAPEAVAALLADFTRASGRPEARTVPDGAPATGASAASALRLRPGRPLARRPRRSPLTGPPGAGR